MGDAEQSGCPPAAHSGDGATAVRRVDMIGRRARTLLAASVFAFVGGIAHVPAAVAAGPNRPAVVWHRTWNEAQAAARAEGKLVLVSSTRAGCCLCERFRNETVPQCAGALTPIA